MTVEGQQRMQFLKQTTKKIIPAPLDSIRRSILSSSSSNLSALFCTEDNSDATDPDETDGNCRSRSKLEVVASTKSSRFLDDSSPNLHSWTGRRCSRIDCSCLIHNFVRLLSRLKADRSNFPDFLSNSDRNFFFCVAIP